jgi:hypothetical protein
MNQEDFKLAAAPIEQQSGTDFFRHGSSLQPIAGPEDPRDGHETNHEKRPRHGKAYFTPALVEP